jgi:hypothetical protein
VVRNPEHGHTTTLTKISAPAYMPIRVRRRSQSAVDLRRHPARVAAIISSPLWGVLDVADGMALHRCVMWPGDASCRLETAGGASHDWR